MFVPSTFSELMRRFRASTAHWLPTLLVAERQSAGRGRLGRAWHSEAAKSLTFSLGLVLERADWSGLSLAVGVALSEALEPRPSEPVQVGLKWPNDLQIAGRKLGGILVESAAWEGQRYAVVGVGLNVLPLTKTISSESADRPTACVQELWPHATPAAVLQLLALPLLRAVKAFDLHGFEPFQARFARRDVLLGQHISSGSGPGAISGRASGVAGNGALQVATAQAMQLVTSSEVSFTPMQAVPC
jgi:BirA family transcriptional regulator, biotin operon repressor / biotin---[acetyl-CoA-carboxylase] ligase